MRIPRKMSNPNQATQPLTYVAVLMALLRTKYYEDPKLGWGGGYNLKNRHLTNVTFWAWSLGMVSWWIVAVELLMYGITASAWPLWFVVVAAIGPLLGMAGKAWLDARAEELQQQQQ